MRWRLWACGAVALLLTCVGAQPAAGAAPLSPAWPELDELGKKLEDRSRPLLERLEIIDAFTIWTGAEVRPPLVAVLKDPLAPIRAAAARALGWPGNSEAVPELRALVETPEEVTAVKAAALRSLGQIGDGSVRALVITATQAPDASIREAAFWCVTFGTLVDPADRTVFLIQVAEDRAVEAQLRVDAVSALAGVREAGVVDALARILETEPPVTIVVPQGTPTQEQTMVLRRLQARNVAAWAASALGQLEARSTLPLLLRSAVAPNDFFLRQLSIRSLVYWNVPEAFPVLVRGLDDPLPENRMMSLTGLARLGDQRAVDPVLATLSDPDSGVRQVAVRTVAWLGGPKVRPQLEVLQQKESDPGVRGVLENALSRLGH